jgi:MSHA pilin protein MshD
MIELILFIMIISIALAGTLLVMDTVTGRSADTLIRKQALAIADSLLEEVALQDFISASSASATCPHNQVTTANRASGYHIVCDYNGFTMAAGITDVSGNAVPGLGSYNASVTVADAALGSGAAAIAAGSAVQITVTVTDPLGNPAQVTGYRTAY